MTATVVVPTRDRPGDLARLLRALAAQETGCDFEVVVVDDGSEPPVSVSDFDGELSLRVVRRGGGGPAAARNAGAACNIAYRRETFRALHGFLETFPDPHCEDLDLAFRADALGPIGFVPSVSVLHHPRPLPLSRWIGRARLTGSEAVLFARHRERYGRSARLPARLFPVASALHNWGTQLRAQAPALVRSPRRLARFLLVAAVYIGTVVITAARPRRTGR